MNLETLVLRDRVIRVVGFDDALAQTWVNLGNPI